MRNKSADSHGLIYELFRPEIIGEDLFSSLLMLCNKLIGMWAEETMNNLYEAGVQDEQFALISLMNEKYQVKVKTLVGDTERFELSRIEIPWEILLHLQYWMLCLQRCMLCIDAYLNLRIIQSY